MRSTRRPVLRPTLFALAAAASLAGAGSAQATPFFIPGNLVVSVEGNGVRGAVSGSYTDNQAAPLTLFQYSHSGTASATYVNALVLPQTASGNNAAVSGEYGSSSEGTLQRSGDGRYLTIMGYGVNAAAFNANPTAYGTAVNDPTKPAALGQSGSLSGQGYTPVARVAALIDANGKVDSSTTLLGVFNGNNPRSVASVDGSTLYLSGQGVSGDKTGGVWVAQRGATSATAVTGLDTSKGAAAQDTRIVEIVNKQLYVSVDSKQGSGSNRDFIGTLGSAGNLPAGLANGGNGPAQLNGFGTSNAGKYVITTGNGNGVNAAGQTISLSPEQYFFATASVLYVADSGIPKNSSGSSTLGDGGLQKWVNSSADGSGAWSLAYTLSNGLNLVANNAAGGTTGLLGLTGAVVGGQVELFATNYTIGDLDPTYLLGISDDLAALIKPAGEAFVTLDTAPADSNFKGVAFAPAADTSDVPEPGMVAVMLAGLASMAAARRRKS
ncbi:PEP-CTERM sorting domain-containing protein [Massilia sp. 9096]|uniref:PEP-CTERM sorting domain-containing protein n=1 Tax=Massilia sp. 9096 TaxID=1500894 RepID=UPI00055BC32E|nr:PEP-CTERM sorting domain-containing protein [Massilia sp. 9096]